MNNPYIYFIIVMVLIFIGAVSLQNAANENCWSGWQISDKSRVVVCAAQIRVRQIHKVRDIEKRVEELLND